MKDSTDHNFEELLSAYLDGELSAAETALVERRLSEDPVAARTLDELRRTVGMVRTLPRHPAPSAILEDIRSRLERVDLLDGPDVYRRAERGRSGLRWLALAASLVVVSSAGWWIWAEGRIGPLSPARVASRTTEETKVPARSRELAPVERKDAPVSSPPAPATSVAVKAVEDSAMSDRSRAEAKKEVLPEAVAIREPSNTTSAVSATEKAKKDVGLMEQGVAPGQSGGAPVRVQVAVASEADRDRAVSMVEQQFAGPGQSQRNSQGVARRLSQSGQDVAGKKQEALSPGAEELLVVASLDELNSAISRLGGSATNTRSVSIQAGAASAQGVLQVQDVLNQVAIQQIPGEVASRQGTLSRDSEASGSGIFGPFLRALGVEGRRRSGGSTLPKSPESQSPDASEKVTDAAPGVDALANQAMNLEAAASRDAAPEPVAAGSNARSAGQMKSAGVAESDRPTTGDLGGSKQQDPPSLVDRRLEEARQRKFMASRAAAGAVVGPPDAPVAAEDVVRQAPSQMLTVVFEFVVDQKPPIVVDSPRSVPNDNGAAKKEDAAKEQVDKERPR